MEHKRANKTLLGLPTTRLTPAQLLLQETDLLGAAHIALRSRPHLLLLDKLLVPLGVNDIGSPTCNTHIV